MLESEGFVDHQFGSRQWWGQSRQLFAIEQHQGWTPLKAAPLLAMLLLAHRIILKVKLIKLVKVAFDSKLVLERHFLEIKICRLKESNPRPVFHESQDHNHGQLIFCIYLKFHNSNQVNKSCYFLASVMKPTQTRWLFFESQPLIPFGSEAGGWNKSTPATCKAVNDWVTHYTPPPMGGRGVNERRLQSKPGFNEE